MRYLKRCLAVLVTVGLFVSPAFAKKVSTMSNKRMYSASYSGIEVAHAIINKNSMKTRVRPFNWANRISIGGLVNVDGIFAQRGWNVAGHGTAGVIPNFKLMQSESGYPPVDSSSDVSITNANLLFDFKPTSWLKAHVGLVYKDRLGPVGKSWEHLDADEIYVTLSDLRRLPFYLRAGKVFAPIGSHETPYPLTPSFTFLMTQTQATLLQLGYVTPSTQGFFGSVFAFNSPFAGVVLFGSENVSTYSLPSNTDYPLARASRIRNFGAKLGYKASYRGFCYDVEASYLKDFRDTRYFSENELSSVFSFETVHDASSNSDRLRFRRAALYALHGYMTKGMYDFSLDYAALTRSLDESGQAMNINLNTRMWAYDLRAGYWFVTSGYKSKVQLGYQRSGHAIFTSRDGTGSGSSHLNPARYLPRYRYIVDYIVNVSARTTFTLQYAYAKDYDAPANIIGETANLNHQSDNTLKARLAVSF